jgi:hypothetical protein
LGVDRAFFNNLPASEAEARREAFLSDSTNSEATSSRHLSPTARLLHVLRSRRFVYAAIFIASFATYVATAYGGLGAPPEPGDSHDYDAIAYNLWKGRGYGYFWSDPEYRAPYEGRARYRSLLGRQSDYYPTAYRPPALPIVLSVIYAASDRNFAVWRILNAGFVAGAVTLAAAIAAHFGGLLAAPLCAIVLVQHPQLTRYSYMYMTEGMAAFLLTLLAYLWIRNSRGAWSLRRAATFGIVVGALMTARSIFVLWISLAAFIPSLGAGLRNRLVGKVVCVLCALLVIGPWWVRNIMVTGAFMPTGTQAPLNLPMGFGPRALMFEGLWRSNPGDGVEELNAAGVNPFSIEHEVRLAKIRSAIALEWMRENPVDVLRLMGMHVWQEVRPRGRIPWDWLLPAGALGLLFFRRAPGSAGIALMLAAQILSVALTWGAGGRFMVPVHPLLVALVCAMIVMLVVRGASMGVARLGRDPQPA